MTAKKHNKSVKTKRKPSKDSKNKGGRPLLFKTVEQLQHAIDAYFAECDPHMVEKTEWVQARDASGKLLNDEHGLHYLVEVTHKVMTERVPYTVSGLALALGTSRQTLVNYEERDRFFDTIKKAKLRVEEQVEQSMLKSNGVVAGVIFNAKNNFDWKDKTETDITSGGEKLDPYAGLSTAELRKLARGK